MVQEQVLTYAGAGISDYRDAVDPAQAYIRVLLDLHITHQQETCMSVDGDSRTLAWSVDLEEWLKQS